jgi:pyruvate-ferredoxin/flavodoxin oxidoreductase
MPGSEFIGMKVTLQTAPRTASAAASACATAGQEPGGPERGRRNLAPKRRSGAEAANWECSLSLPELAPERVKRDSVKGSQLVKPLFVFSAPAQLRETPYLKLLSHCRGPALIANATADLI